MTRSDLAAAYLAAGRLDEAIPLFERTLTDYERVLGGTHPAHPGLPQQPRRAYRGGRAAGAGHPAAGTYPRRPRAGPRPRPPRHSGPPATTSPPPTLAAGRLEQAIPLLERTLADCERILGPDHPDTLASRNNLAAAYQAAGRLEQAIALYERTLADRERVLGPDHPDTLTSRNNLAAAYRRPGGWSRRSCCTSAPLPTASGSSAPTTPTP